MRRNKSQASSAVALMGIEKPRPMNGFRLLTCELLKNSMCMLLKKISEARRAVIVIVSVKRDRQSIRARSRATNTKESEAIERMSLFQQPASLSVDRAHRGAPTEAAA
jgi:hypothetical protein